ncbi:MAG: hypothetical protein VX938_00800, partial [Myxococcota bacterium]|nr:hypothetical protein [Myxococcota bacterium]
MSDPVRAALIAHYRSLLSRHLAQRPWVVAMDVLVVAARYARELQGLGVESVVAIGASRGTGELPSSEVVPQIDLGSRADTGMMQAIHDAQAALTDLPAEVRAAVDRLDPQRAASVIGTIFCSHLPVADRPIFGARPLAWQALEDKMIIDAVWDAVGLRRAPCEVVPLSEGGAAAQRLDSGMGTVWVGDNRDGWHGGASRLHWVRTAEAAHSARTHLSEHCDRVRVMPFLDGIPCSIHGWVFPDSTVIALRPCEMLVFRTPGSGTLCYGGAATSWKPPEPVGGAMRSAALRVGEHLRDTVGYRGSFTLDGVVTAEGFLPTELNPRFGAAIGRMANSMPELPLYLLHLCTAEGLELDYRPHDLERLVIEEAEANPVVTGARMLEGRFDLEPRQAAIVRS